MLQGAGALLAADNRPIGVFDSGTGGLTVLEKMLTDDFAHEKFVYLGDQANMPYGDYAAAGKSDFLRGLVIKDAEFLLGKDAKIIVIACNTATAYGYDAVANLLARRGDGTKVIGVVNAGARSVIRQLDLVNHPKPCAIGVMATPGTIASGVYERTIKSELKKLGVTCEVQVFSRGCAGLADAVEAGSKDAPKIATDNLRALFAEHRAKAPQLPLRAVILGCTHFPFVQRELETVAPKGVVFIDPAVDTAAECAATLKAQDRRTDAQTPMAVETFVSVAAPGLEPSKLDEKGGLTRVWKYGRTDAASDRSTVPVPILEATKGDPLKFIPFAHMIPRVREFLAAKAPDAVELKNGAEFTMDDVPEELTVRVKRGGSVRFLIEENATTGYQWEATYASNECAVAIEHRGAAAANGLCGAPGKAAFTVTKNVAVQSPSLVEFSYRRSWEKDAKPTKTVRLVLYTIPGEQVDFRYPASRTLNMLKAECQNRGIELVDWHVHIRGGLTPEMAAEREKACGIRQSAMENHGREWEIFDNARLAAFAEKARAVKVNGHTLPVGIQVNDRDWFRQIDAATRAKFDYILADTMIMGKLPNGRDKRLWLVKDISEIGDPEKWMDDYVAMNLQILDEPISILANPGYLPAPLDALHDKLWTDERMRKVIGKAARRGIAIEIQAESPYPSPKFLRLAKAMGAKFSFGTNNYDAAPKDLSRWLEAIVWLDLHGSDIWTPTVRPARDRIFFVGAHPDDTEGFAATFTTFDGKPIEGGAPDAKTFVGNECAWDAKTGRERAEICRKEFKALTASKIGFIAHALMPSRVADLNHHEDPTLETGLCMPFLNADGSLRPDHGFFNEF